MDEKVYPRPEDWLEKRAELQRRVNRIKIILWAYDFEAAKREIADINERFGDLLSKSLEVKGRFTSAYRKNRSWVAEELREEGLRGLSLKHQIRERMAEMLQLRDKVEDALYILSPIAATVHKLDERIAEQKGQPLLFDDRSGFHYTVGLVGYQQREIRAYRLDPPPVNPEELVAALQEHIESTLFEVVDRDARRPGWPLWQRTFLKDASLELKFYDPGRFIVSITGSRETSIDRLQFAIFGAVASAQEHSKSQGRDDRR